MSCHTPVRFYDIGCKNANHNLSPQKTYGRKSTSTATLIAADIKEQHAKQYKNQIHNLALEIFLM